MRSAQDKLTEGGRIRPLFAIKGHFKLNRQAIGFVASVCLCLSITSFAFGQGRFARIQPPSERAENAPQDAIAVALIMAMLTPQAAYTGEQITERGARVSHQQVRGLKGRIRMDFTEPSDLAGDVMLISRNQYRYYHKKTNVLDIALWPSPMNMVGQEKRIADAIHQKRLSVMKVGEEIVAGRGASIVQLSGGKAFGGPHGFQSKFWIDKETGIKLGQEISGPRGTVSRSYFIRITIGPAAKVSPKDFEPTFLQTAQTNPLFPRGAQQYHSVTEARGQLTFTPLEPGSLPPGFRLSAVWVFPGLSNARTEGAAALLRYTDSVTYFILYQRPARSDGKSSSHRGGPPRFQRSIQRWQVSAPDGTLREITYIGHLPAEQAQAVHDSLR